MKMKLAIAALLAAACAASAFAGPAPYIWYTSKVTGERACSNFQIGSGWTAQPTWGKFKDANCSVPY